MFFKTLLSIFALLQFTISVDVDLVVFNVTVTDKDGRAARGLTAENFHIFEDGREEKIKIFLAEDTPSTIGLVMDNSGSMTNKRTDVVTAASSFVNASHPDDEMFIVNFNVKPWMGLPEEVPFTSDRNLLRNTLAETKTSSTTALYDALGLALEHLKSGTKQRKALVVLSDGGDNASRSNLDDILRIAQESSATIYCIGIYDPEQKDRNPDVLRRIAKVTGGEAYFPKRLRDLREIWPRIATSIRGQYTLGYLSTNAKKDGSYRKVVIKAEDRRGKALEIRARPGYSR
jgi:Ca-activated chloride channel family protein